MDEDREYTNSKNSGWWWIIPTILLPVFFFLGFATKGYMDTTGTTANGPDTQYGVGGAPPVFAPTGSSGMTEPTQIPTETETPLDSGGPSVNTY